MKTIWKYRCPNVPVFKLLIPEGGKILHFGRQRDEFSLWIEVDTSRHRIEREFFLTGTGLPIPNGFDSQFIGTVISEGGQFVFHLFEVMIVLSDSKKEIQK